MDNMWTVGTETWLRLKVERAKLLIACFGHGKLSLLPPSPTKKKDRLIFQRVDVFG